MKVLIHKTVQLQAVVRSNCYSNINFYYCNCTDSSKIYQDSSGLITQTSYDLHLYVLFLFTVLINILSFSLILCLFIKTFSFSSSLSEKRKVCRKYTTSSLILYDYTNHFLLPPFADLTRYARLWTKMNDNAPLKRFACDICNKKYLSKRSLRNHQSFECGRPRQFACDQCGYRFMYKHHLQRHIARKSRC